MKINPSFYLSRLSKGKTAFSVWMAVMTIFPVSSAWAANGTWLDTGTTSPNWNTSSNWVSGVIPGSTSGSNSSPNTDIATFNSAVGTFGTSMNPIIIDSSSQYIGQLGFTSAAGAYTIGTTNGNSLFLNEGGTSLFSIADSSNATETINAPIVITGAVGGATEFENLSASGALNIGGTIMGNQASGNTALALRTEGGVNNTSVNTVSGVISNGTAGSTLSLVITAVSSTGASTGIWDLTGANTFTGQVTFVQGTLIINTLAASGAQSLGEATGTNGPLVLGGAGDTAILEYNGTSAGATSRAITLTNSTTSPTSVTLENASANSVSFGGAITLAATPTSGGNSNLILGGTGNGTVGEISPPPARRASRSLNWEPAFGLSPVPTVTPEERR